MLLAARMSGPLFSITQSARCDTAASVISARVGMPFFALPSSTWVAQIQEQILWMCEAAQVPVIWATQVLEGKAKKGMPTRAEITDAAVSQRADCVMLNKGPHILAAISMLDDILRSMQDHQHKKTSRLRKLKFTEM